MPPGNPPPYPPPPSAPSGPYPPPPPPPYLAPPQGYYAPPAAKTNWWAIVSLISGVLGGVLISLICGIVGLNKAKQGQGGRGLAIAGLVLSGLWVLLLVVGIIFYFAIGKGTVTATDVEVGDCLSEIPDSARVLTVQTVECEQMHAGEVYAVLTMPDGDFPGQAAVDEYSNKCEPELAAYSPDAMTDDSIQMYVLYPTAESWEQGDRAVTCVATLDPPRTGSIKG
jgi:TM2 domain-containing membrane protein YozV